MATYANIETEVRANINNTTATVSGVIDQAINLLSNFFSRKIISSAISTVAGQDYIDKPSNCLEVEKIKISDDYYDRIDVDGAEESEKYETKRFFEYNDKLQLSVEQDSVVACKIWYKAGFTPLAGVAAAVTDIPDNKLPALYLLATWLYWLRIVSVVGTEREEFPDMTVAEAETIAENWGKQFRELLNIIRKGR